MSKLLIYRLVTPSIIVLTFMVLPPILGIGEFASAAEKMCWTNAKTGKPAPVELRRSFINRGDPNHAYDTATGENYVRQPDGTWINAKTGKPAPLELRRSFINQANPNHAYNPAAGENYVRVPCPNPGMKIPSKKTSGLQIKPLRPTKTMTHQEMTPTTRPMLMPQRQKCGNDMMGGGGLSIGGDCKMK